MTYTESEVDDGCLRIYAAGLDATVYRFLVNRPDVLTTLEKTRGLPRHVQWEHGKSVPDLRRESDG